MAYSNFYARFLDFFGNLRTNVLTLWRYYPSRIYLSAIVFFQALSFWQAFWIKTNLSGDVLVLRYKIDFGANLVGEPSLVFQYPLISLGIFGLNFILAALFSSHRDKKVFMQLFLAGSAVFSCFMSLYLLSVFLINFR